MPNYLALTLGPIQKTITQQRRTRAVFAASYLFSYTMREIVKKLLTADKGHVPIKGKVLAPSTGQLGQIEPGCGLYGDRLIIETNAPDDDYPLLIKARNEVLEHLADKMEDAKGSYPKKIMLPYLKGYLQAYCLRVELEQNQETIEHINRHLDHLELNPNFPAGVDSSTGKYLTDEDQLLRFFSEVNGHFILEDAFGNKETPFSSLEEIATRSLSRKPKYHEIIPKDIRGRDRDELDHSVFELLLKSELKEELRAYHKYVAIIHVDADSMGAYTEALSANGLDQYRLLSDDLAAFGLKAREAIDQYGGAPVYIGGDDLLFFAPVASHHGNQKDAEGNLKLETIFDLVNTLDNHFYNHIRKNAPEGAQLPTLSYGISFSYYKYPLNEALKISNDLLSKAKQQPGKNSIAFKILKHSGQYFDAVLPKENNLNEAGPLYQHFQELLKHTKVDTDFINSITHGMAFFQNLFYDLIIEHNDEEAVQHLFDNNFNEAIHKQHRDFINKIVSFVCLAYRQQDKARKAKPVLFKAASPEAERQRLESAALSIVYSTLRFIHFIRSKPTQS